MQHGTNQLPELLSIIGIYDSMTSLYLDLLIV